ncbi:hypothetical protein NE237_030890 [Protea cynaroides]|uniref:Uncharacterized protein n=1 Tax=Protea cynaroides TaxID=273540 RepID=A0A9Q0GUK3_9MAGN|nr:hypothetical protein NE237_030890 [Protea cynaroides]
MINTQFPSIFKLIFSLSSLFHLNDGDINYTTLHHFSFPSPPSSLLQPLPSILSLGLSSPAQASCPSLSSPAPLPFPSTMPSFIKNEEDREVTASNGSTKVHENHESEP